MERQRLIELLFAAAAVSFLVVGCFLVLRPFLSALMWAVILCYASWPFYRWLVRKLGGRRSLTAILMTCGVAAILVLPFVIVGFTLAENVSDWVTAVKEWVGRGLPPPPAWVSELPMFGAGVDTFVEGRLTTASLSWEFYEGAAPVELSAAAAGLRVDGDAVTLTGLEGRVFGGALAVYESTFVGNTAARGGATRISSSACATKT